MDSTLLIIVIMSLVGGVVQGIISFGGNLVRGPVLLALLAPPVAIMATFLGGMLLNAAIVAEREAGTPPIWKSEVIKLLVAGVPGIVLGVLLLHILDKADLQIIIGTTIIIAAGIQYALKDRPSLLAGSGKHQRHLGTYPAGVVTGVMSATLGINGPPIALWLRSRGMSGHCLRRTMNSYFLASIPMCAVALYLSFPQAFTSAVIIPFITVAIGTAFGYPLGRAIYRRYRHYQGLEIATYAVIFLSGLIALWQGIL